MVVEKTQYFYHRSLVASCNKDHKFTHMKRWTSITILTATAALISILEAIYNSNLNSISTLWWSEIRNMLLLDNFMSACRLMDIGRDLGVSIAMYPLRYLETFALSKLQSTKKSRLFGYISWIIWIWSNFQNSEKSRNESIGVVEN